MVDWLSEFSLGNSAAKSASYSSGNFFLISRPRLTCILLKFTGYAFCILTDVFLSKLSLSGSELVSLVITVGVLCSRSDV